VAIFISYSSRDDGAIRQLVADLRAARMDVWLDQQLWGGDTWWQTILHQVRNCSVLIFALSSHSLRSQPCMAELRYAQALGLPILPVQIGAITSLRALPLAHVQVVDYRVRSPAASIALISAVHENVARRGAPPSTLPPEPPIPYEYLIRLSTLVASATVLDPHEQAGIVAQLRQALEDEHEPAVREDVIGLLRQLRERSDVTFRAGKEIDALSATISHPQGRPLPTPELPSGGGPLPGQSASTGGMPSTTSRTGGPARDALVWARLPGTPVRRWAAAGFLVVAAVATPVLVLTLSHRADGSTPATASTPTSSSSAASVVVPNVRGLSVSAATGALEQKSFVVRVATTAGKGLVKGSAVGTSPAAGQPVPPGSTVTLQLSDGKVRIPNVVGKSDRDAVSALKAEGVTAAEILVIQVPGDRPVGQVFQQEPAPGTVDTPTQIKIWTAVRQ
jgi:hypothetical protein